MFNRFSNYRGHYRRNYENTFGTERHRDDGDRGRGNNSRGEDLFDPQRQLLEERRRRKSSRGAEDDHGSAQRKDRLLIYENRTATGNDWLDDLLGYRATIIYSDRSSCDDDSQDDTQDNTPEEEPSDIDFVRRKKKEWYDPLSDEEA